MVYLRHFVLASVPWKPELHDTIFSVGLVEAKPHWNRILCEWFGFLLSLIVPSMLHIHSSDGGMDNRLVRGGRRKNTPDKAKNLVRIVTTSDHIRDLSDYSDCSF